MLSNWSCTRGMFHDKIYLISPGCPLSSTVQNFCLNHFLFHLISEILKMYISQSSLFMLSFIYITCFKFHSFRRTCFCCILFWAPLHGIISLLQFEHSPYYACICNIFVHPGEKCRDKKVRRQNQTTGEGSKVNGREVRVGRHFDGLHFRSLYKNLMLVCSVT